MESGGLTRQRISKWVLLLQTSSWGFQSIRQGQDYSSSSSNVNLEFSVFFWIIQTGLHKQLLVSWHCIFAFFWAKNAAVLFLTLFACLVGIKSVLRRHRQNVLLVDVQIFSSSCMQGGGWDRKYHETRTHLMLFDLYVYMGLNVLVLWNDNQHQKFNQYDPLLIKINWTHTFLFKYLSPNIWASNRYKYSTMLVLLS